MKKNTKVAVLAAGVVTLGVVGYAITVTSDKNKTSTPVVSQAQSQPVQNNDTKVQDPKTTTRSTEELLLYLIEEEKLAHDVYSVMYQKYGANVFGNILQSESTHQDKVLSLLQARNIQDPRSAEVGVFKNTELQALYNTLISQGNKSATDAYKVGVIIEEKDIADISAQLATATEQDAIDILEVLRKGSENHLRAFNKKL